MGAVGKRDKTKAGKSGAGRGKRSGVPDVGDVLRTAYQRTIDEKIPDEMLDLLGRLG